MADSPVDKWAANSERLNTFQGYFLQSISLSALQHEDLLDIGFASTPESPDLAIRIGGVYHFSIDKPEGLAGAFVDEFILQFIPKVATVWPVGISGNLGPHPGSMPDLFWLQIVGPVGIDIVARFLTIVESR